MIVVSDVSGTLTTGSPVLGLVDWVRHHQSKFRANWFSLTSLFSYPLAKWEIINWNRWATRFMINSLPLIKNADETIVRQMAEWAVEHQLWPKRRADVLEELGRLRDEGARVILVSSIFLPAVQVFADRIGAEAIGSPLEIVGGRLRFANDIVMGPEKITQIKEKIGVDQVTAAFGDTQADIPMLELAQRPVAVYPDTVLRETAVQRGWEIMDGWGG